MCMKWTVRAAATALIVAGVTAAATLSASAASRRDGRHHHLPATKPTIVLVHGAWADSGSWDAVLGRLQRDGYVVWAPTESVDGLGQRLGHDR